MLLHGIYLFGPLYIEIYLYEVKLCCDVLIKAQARNLFQKIINPSKILTSVELVYSYGRK